MTERDGAGSPRSCPDDSPQPFAVRLLAWFDAARRDLPWRRNRDPWAIWVSEIMLQQTRVEAVRTAYERFLDRFPTPATFAAASDDELLAAWRGLGYYRRARLLRDGARAVVREHAGEVPRDPTTLRELPGIGVYTCGAIASIAFGAPLPAIDGNVERVLARHLAITTSVKRSPARRAIDAAVRERQPEDRAGDFNQALMELGAMICTPKSPRCTECPVATDCRARADGRVEHLPVLEPRRTAVEVTSRAVICAADDAGRIWAMRAPPGAINQGQLDLPGPGVLVDCANATELQRALLHEFGLRAHVGDPIATVRHGITHHRVTLVTHHARMVSPATPAPRSLEAASPTDPAAPWTTVARKAFARALDAGGA